MKILAVNPWVYDFTYYDLYAKPYGLLMLATLLKREGHHIDFIDLCFAENYDVRFAGKRKKDGTAGFYKEEVTQPPAYSIINRRYFRFGLPPSFADKLLQNIEKPDIILVASIMTYWYLGVKETVALLKRHFPEAPCYLGGVYATLLPDHAKENVGVDFVIPGRAKELFKTVLNKEIKEDFAFPELELFYKRLHYLPVLTSLGCPFSCDYCASKAIYKGDLFYCEPSECFNYLEKYSKLYNTKTVAFYDDALLFRKEEHLYKILEKVIKADLKLKFYSPNGLHIRFIDEKCADILYEGGFEKLRLSLEFIEKSPYDNKTDIHEFERAVKLLHKAGFKQEQIGVYLICGIEGQNKETLKKAIDYVYENGAYPYLSEYSPVPGAKMFSHNSLKSRYPLSEPLYHNNSILPMEHEGFTYEDFLELKNYNRQQRSNLKTDD